MKTGEEYRQSLRERNIKVYVMGELVEGAAVIDHPLIKGHVNSAARRRSPVRGPDDRHFSPDR